MATKQKPAKKLTLKQTRFLATYSGCGCVALAARMAGNARATHYMALSNPTYATAFAEAEQDFADELRHAATTRAIHGVKRLKFHQGTPCMVPLLNKDGTVKLNKEGGMELVPYEEIEYSDSLLIQLLRAHCPEFVEKQIREHTGPGGGPALTENKQEVQFMKTLDQLSAENLMHVPADKDADPTVRTREITQKKAKPKAKKSKT